MNFVSNILPETFCEDNFPNDPLVKLAEVCFQVGLLPLHFPISNSGLGEAIPPVLEATGKVKSLG